MSLNYTEPEQLLADESFLSWYFKSDAKGQEVLESWMAGDSQRQRLVQRAVELLDSVRFQEEPVPAQRLELAERKLLGRLMDSENATGGIPFITAEKRQSLYNYRRWMVAAAVLLVFCSGVIFVSVRSAKWQMIKTEYGELVSRQLPDGTEVTMDANSKLRYSSSWLQGANREVWLEGEAFFHVSKSKINSRFIVHSAHFDITVTGTRFNVVNRNGAENILLQEGSVILHDVNGNERSMHPGEFVSFGQSNLLPATVNSDSVIAWKERKLVLDKTPLRDLITIVHDRYGVHIKLENASLGDSTISGILPNDRLDILLQALDETPDFTIIRKDDQITIAARKGQN